MLPGRGVALPAPIHTPQPRNIGTHQWHQPGSAPQNAPHEVKPVLHYLLLTGNRFCLFCTQKQQESISTAPQTNLSGEGSCRPGVLPSPACPHPRGVLPPRSPPALAPMTYFSRRRIMPQQRPWSLVTAGCPGSQSPGETPRLSQPKKASAKPQGGPESPLEPPPALDPAH